MLPLAQPLAPLGRHDRSALRLPGLILLALAEFGLLPMGVAVAIGVGIIILQFALGPWLMDLALRWIYKFSWVPVDQLPAHLRDFVTRVAGEQNMKVPWFGLIHDGAPNAFTYGHHPGNMRIVITQGILDLLEPEEVEGVVAHEIGHGKNWDMLLMTVVQLVPLLLYFLYRTALRVGDRGKDGGYRVAVAVECLCLVHRRANTWCSGSAAAASTTPTASPAT